MHTSMCMEGASTGDWGASTNAESVGTSTEDAGASVQTLAPAWRAASTERDSILVASQLIMAVSITEKARQCSLRGLECPPEAGQKPGSFYTIGVGKEMC